MHPVSATAPTKRLRLKGKTRQKLPSRILTIDLGGTKLKVLATGQTEPRKKRTGEGFTPSKLVRAVQDLAEDWDYDAVSLGYPGLVGDGEPRSEPGNLGAGWVGFDYSAAFERPVRIVNDAAMQALGSYEGGRMLFLGLGTGLGSARVADNVIVTLELGQLPYKGRYTIGEVLGRRGLARSGKLIRTERSRDMAATDKPSMRSERQHTRRSEQRSHRRSLAKPAKRHGSMAHHKPCAVERFAIDYNHRLNAYAMRSTSLWAQFRSFDALAVTGRLLAIS